MLKHSAANNRLLRDDARFDPWTLRWVADAGTHADAREIGVLDALAWLYEQPDARRVPVAVIGPGEAADHHRITAEDLGRRLGDLGVPMLSGGRTGVMEAASRGNRAAGGLPIGILPGTDWEEANPYVAIPLATGIGEARNAIIARAALALIAVGGEYGTLSEMALGLRFGRLVLALEDAPDVAGAVRCPDVDTALKHLAGRILGLDDRDD
ncbi:MAG: TIGR00725 family protein [Pseudomonadota bacterium]